MPTKKTMKKAIKILIVVVFAAGLRPACAQNAAQPQFKPAEATKDHYDALYVINTGDEKKIAGTLRNMNNVLEDPRLKGKIHLELVAFGDGVAVYEKSGPFEQTLKALQAKGVDLAQCSNTVRERHIDPATLFPFISFVPSGNGEIILRHYEGWAVVHP